jgi:manganese transport protein
MGSFASPFWVQAMAWPVAVVIAVLNAYLLWQTFAA